MLTLAKFRFLNSKSVHILYNDLRPCRGIRADLSRIMKYDFYSFRRSISYSKLSIEFTTDETSFDKRPPKEKLVFGTTPTSHMLMIEWNVKDNWKDPKIVPYQDLRLSPAASSLHYGMNL